jgi:heme-degrading monooxygenase HmoA
MRKQQGYQGLEVLTDALSGEGLIISHWETEAAAEASESNSSYIGQMSMMSSFLQEHLTPKTYEVDVHT